MISKKSFIMFLFLSLILFGCEVLTKDSYDFYKDVETTDLSSENINSVHIGSSENEIIEKFGVPQKEDQDDSFKNISYENNGLLFLLKNNKLIEYRINNSNYSTNKGIKVGDNKQKVIEKYGKNYYTKKEDRTYSAIGYFDKVKKLHIEFGLSKGKVTFINVVDMR